MVSERRERWAEISPTSGVTFAFYTHVCQCWAWRLAWFWPTDERRLSPLCAYGGPPSRWRAGQYSNWRAVIADVTIYPNITIHGKSVLPRDKLWPMTATRRLCRLLHSFMCTKDHYVVYHHLERIYSVYVEIKIVPTVITAHASFRWWLSLIGTSGRSIGVPRYAVPSK